MKKLYFNILIMTAVVTGGSYILYMTNHTIRTQFDGISTHLKVLVTHAGQRACRFLGCDTCPVKPSEPGHEKFPPSPPPPACGELNQSCGTANKFGVVKQCCGDLVCVNKICKAPEIKSELKPVIEKPVIPTLPGPACVELNQSCAVNKKCCGNTKCLDNTCKFAEPACVELNQDCFENKKCCGDATCIDDFCRPKAPDLATRPFGAPAMAKPLEPTPAPATIGAPNLGTMPNISAPAPTPTPVTIVPAPKAPVTGPAIPTATPADSLFKKPDYTRPASMLSETPAQAGSPTPPMTPPVAAGIPPVVPPVMPKAPAPGSPTMGTTAPMAPDQPMERNFEHPDFNEPKPMGPTGLTPTNPPYRAPENFEHPDFNRLAPMTNKPAMGITPVPATVKPIPKPATKTNKPDAGPTVFSSTGSSVPVLQTTKNENIDLTLSPFEQQCNSLGVDYKYCSIYVYSADAPDGIALEGCYDTVVCEAIATT